MFYSGENCEGNHVALGAAESSSMGYGSFHRGASSSGDVTKSCNYYCPEDCPQCRARNERNAKLMALGGC